MATESRPDGRGMAVALRTVGFSICNEKGRAHTKLYKLVLVYNHPLEPHPAGTSGHHSAPHYPSPYLVQEQREGTTELTPLC